MRTAVLLVLALLAPPASGAGTEDLLLTDSGSGSAALNDVHAGCTASFGAAADLNHTSYVVHGAAYATSRAGAQAVGTTLSCWIRDTRSGEVFGPPVTGFAPGGTAVAAGTIRARNTGYLAMCTEAYALFDDNTPAAHYKTYGC
jgi:hypothetical protein